MGKWLGASSFHKQTISDHLLVSLFCSYGRTGRHHPPGHGVLWAARGHGWPDEPLCHQGQQPQGCRPALLHLLRIGEEPPGPGIYVSDQERLAGQEFGKCMLNTDVQAGF